MTMITPSLRLLQSSHSSFPRVQWTASGLSNFFATQLQIGCIRGRFLATQSAKPSPSDIVIIGGGITGLTSAFYLSRRFPEARIVILEKSARDGGWIRSRRVAVEDGEGHSAQILLEAGPRTLRPNNSAILELVNLLGLQSSVITTPKSAPAAKHRFLQIPGRPGLTGLPSSALSLLTSPFIASLLVPPVLAEPFRRANRPEASDDESVDAFLTRRFGQRLAQTMGSALVHGIYAADSRKLSVQAAFPSLWEAEARGGGSLVKGMLRSKDKQAQEDDYEVGDVRELLKDASVYSFADGMEALPKALFTRLASTSSVTVRKDTEVIDLHVDSTTGKIEIRLASGESLEASHVVSAIPLPKLQKITSSVDGDALPHLKHNPNSSVKVINIVFPPTPRPIHPPGFGYLVPRSSAGYDAPESGFLGAVFDSCALAAQDRGDAGFTKLTVMLGGPYTPSLSSTVTEPGHVLGHLQQHLAPGGTRLPEPVYYKAVNQQDCIPTPTIGHVGRMKELKAILKKGAWKGRLEIVGAGVGGVSVGDCVEAGRSVGKDW